MASTGAAAAVKPYPRQKEMYKKLASAANFQTGLTAVLKPYHAKVQAEVLAVVSSEGHDFGTVQATMRSFWASFVASPSVTPALLAAPETLTLCVQADSEFYESVIQQLIPDVFKLIDPDLTKQIRSFAKKIDKWLSEALQGSEESFVHAKLQCALLFGQKLRRYTGLNHLVQAARAVLKNGDHVLRMQEDYAKVDFEAVKVQVVAMCNGCSVETIARHEEKFRDFQRNDCTITNWALWLQDIVREGMGAHDGDDRVFARRGSQLLLRWSFISSLILRDLTLRSATSFGPFHLMRLLCDEYMYFLVEGAKRSRECVAITHESLKGDVPAKLPERSTGATDFAQQWLNSIFENVRDSNQRLNVLQLYQEHVQKQGHSEQLSSRELGELLVATFMLQKSNADATNCVGIRRKVAGSGKSGDGSAASQAKRPPGAADGQQDGMVYPPTFKRSKTEGGVAA